MKGEATNIKTNFISTMLGAINQNVKPTNSNTKYLSLITAYVVYRL